MGSGKSGELKAGDTVVVSGAAGGVGSLAVQLAKNAGAKVIGLAGEANQQWLTDHGITAIVYGDGQAERIKAATGGKVDAFIDTFGNGYVELALELGVPANRINTIIDFEAVQNTMLKPMAARQHQTRKYWLNLPGFLASGKLELEVAKTYPLDQVRDAYSELEQRHTRGKIVLIP